MRRVAILQNKFSKSLFCGFLRGDYNHISTFWELTADDSSTTHYIKYTNEWDLVKMIEIEEPK